MQSVALIDYGSGNLRSAEKALVRAASGSAHILVTNDPETVRTADRIVLPGVGAFAACMAALSERTGVIEAMNDAVTRRGAPFLGICVGMQLMSSRGLEKTVSTGLGWIEGDVVEMTPSDPSLKIPQIGWNTLEIRHTHPLFDGIKTGADGLHAYFVHSYHLAAKHSTDVIATTNYGGAMTAFVGRDNMAGAQFHPEKSQTRGLALISNFLRWKP